MKETIAKINKTKFFENTNKIDKLLARLIKKKKKKKEKNQINKIRNEIGYNKQKKYKGSENNIMSNYMLTKQTT